VCDCVIFVDILYVDKPIRDYVQETAQTIVKIHKFEHPGDILAFLPGKEEIDAVCAFIKESLEIKYALQFLHLSKISRNESTSSLEILPLYSGLSVSDQMKIFNPSSKGRRRCIVSTNIAETSLTIDGIVYVVDSGYSRQKSYNPTSGVEYLVISPISRSSADQRAGRAGRTKAGKCFRLYEKEDVLPEKDLPEMHRTNLASVILQLKALGIENIANFSFISPPRMDALSIALTNLFNLRAIDEQGNLQEPGGRIMAELPLDPKLSRMLLSSLEFECTEEILSIAALLSVPSIYSSGFKSVIRVGDSARRKFWVQEGDLLTMLNIYNAYVLNKKSAKFCSDHHLNQKSLQKVDEIRNNLIKSLKYYGIKIESCGQDIESLMKCIVS
jgi:ATP-dependent RNA helicase DDX35